MPLGHIGGVSNTREAATAMGLEWCRPISNRASKEAIAKQVASRASSGQIIGLGSGSTSFLTVLALGQRVLSERLEIVVVPTSIEIGLAASAVGLSTCSLIPSHIDWCFDGADEIDPQGRMIKGRGGALYRERLIFSSAKKRLVVADSTKDVEKLGSKFPVPVEIEPDWLCSAYTQIAELPHVAELTLRMGVAKDGPVITEGGRVLLDVRMMEIDSLDPRRLSEIPGVCCTGIFEDFAFERMV